MSARLGAALADYLRARLEPGQNFVLVEGVPTAVAEGMSRAWDDAPMPRLAVVSRSPGLFGGHALSGVSGTQLRNQPGTRGVVLVLCDGEQIPDRQSLNLFESVSPGDLLADTQGMALLAQQQPRVELDGPVRHVRDAVIQTPAANRPSAASVADYLDRVAGGDDPLRALPSLGAFADQAPATARIDAARVADNLALAAKLTSEALLRPAAYPDLRRRANQVLARRPGLAGPQLAAAVNRVMEKLQAGSPELLELLRYEEAQEVLEQRPEKLSDIVRRELQDFRRAIPPGGQAEDLPWDHYLDRADDLRRGPQQRDAARELRDFDSAHDQKIFTPPTRRKLERLLLDKSVNGSNPSCPEAAIVRAAQQLGGLIDRVQVLGPPEPGPASPASTSRTGAGAILTLACARLRLGALMHGWHRAGGTVDGLLLRPAHDDDPDRLLASFSDAGMDAGTKLPPLQLRLYDVDKNTVQVDWRPDLDDAAALRAALLFAEAPALTLSMDGEPTLHAFCGPDNASARPAAAGAAAGLAKSLQALAVRSLDRGLEPEQLRAWAAEWAAACAASEAAGDTDACEALTLAGAVAGNGGTTAALTAFAPLKAEWLEQYLTALWSMVNRAEEPDTAAEPNDAAATAKGIAATTASHHPAHLRLRTRGKPLLPTSEGRIWSLYGGESSRDESGFGGEAFSDVVEQLLTLQPEAAGHLRCVAWGAGAADLLTGQALSLLNKTVGRATIGRIEIFCIGTRPDERPSRETLAAADDRLRDERDILELRYFDSLQEALDQLQPPAGAPAVHLALVTGLSERPGALQIESPEVDPPAEHGEVLFAPRVWQRPKQDRRTLLMPPAASPSGQAWLRLQHAMAEDAWPEPDERIKVPEVRTDTLDFAADLQQIHDLALWVATLDRYATRDSLEQALRDKVAILHQERRLGGDSPLSLVISQKSGGPADRAVGRSLRAAGIVDDPDIALAIGEDLRKIASQGYGILALQAATSGAGINELVGHVVAFSLLATATTPWPLPAGCRVLLVSLDTYRPWFDGRKRADLLAIALDTENNGVHVAAIEVKARRSDEHTAASAALDQLTQTLAATRWAGLPTAGVHSRLWLNRIAEAAYAVARESRFRLDKDELAAIEAFRLGRGSLEWAGVGLVFGPKATAEAQIRQASVPGAPGEGPDIVPIKLYSVQLTEQLLRDATKTNLATLRTVETQQPPLQDNRTRRRPEAKPTKGKPKPSTDQQPGDEEALPPGLPTQELPEAGPPQLPEQPESAAPGSPPGASLPALGEFRPPLLGWDALTGEEQRWRAAGGGQEVLRNGHVEIWGSSGMGKTQFVMSLLGQLAKLSGSHFGIADFKNDYSDDTGFPAYADAQFLDLWNTGAPYNPLALDEDSERAIDTAVIELRDTVEEATKAFTRMGIRQKKKLEKALRETYAVRRTEGRWPTLRTLDDHLDDDLAGVMGDLTRHQLFKSGEALGNVIDHNVVFGLSRIPGNGQTTVLAAGFILSALLLRVQNLPPVPNTIRYVAVIDEAHRVSDFEAVKTMVREGRSKGLAVVLATQQPNDLSDVVAANAQTKICFGLPDATVAAMAARKLQPSNPRLPEQIRTLGVGEALVSLRGESPRLLRMCQAYRDHAALGLPELRRGAH